MIGRPRYAPRPKKFPVGPAKQAAAIELPLVEQSVRTIASKGFPLWEDVPDLELRNQRVTLGYFHLSNQLADLLANDTPDGRFANWCTFAVWSSKTIGATIDPNQLPAGIKDLWLPSPIRYTLAKAGQVANRRSHGAIFRGLAVGNRFIFLEIGVAISRFVDV